MPRLVMFGLVVALAACGARDGRGKEVSSVMQREFSWVIQDKLAGMPRPGRGAPVDADAEFLKEKRITLVVTLTEAPLPAQPFASRGIALVHIPMRDFSAPSSERLAEFVGRASAHIAGGGRVAVHCAYGLGRTGTFLAAYLVHEGSTARAAVAQVRDLRPGSIETASQVAAVQAYEASLRGPADGGTE
ncbi:MAG: dual specificity protein phosphatase family protein [Proteobacteria bacterium]|nr:dual specificity protein phosphatase family protein [Pseudomonadota bacterium]